MLNETFSVIFKHRVLAFSAFSNYASKKKTWTDSRWWGFSWSWRLACPLHLNRLKILVEQPCQPIFLIGLKLVLRHFWNGPSEVFDSTQMKKIQLLQQMNQVSTFFSFYNIFAHISKKYSFEFLPGKVNIDFFFFNIFYNLILYRMIFFNFGAKIGRYLFKIEFSNKKLDF